MSNQNENSNSEANETNIPKENSNKKMVQTGIKGAAIAAGAVVGGIKGAETASKVADEVNKSKIADAPSSALDKLDPALKKGASNNNGMQKSLQPTKNQEAKPNNQAAVTKSSENQTKITPSKPNKELTLTENDFLPNKNPSKLKPGINYNSKTNSKNPSKNGYESASKKNKKHAKDPEIEVKVSEPTQEKKKQEESKQANLRKKNKDTTSSEDKYSEERKEERKAFGNAAKVVGGLAAGALAMFGAIVNFILTHIVLISIVIIISIIIIFLSSIVTIITSFFEYGKNDDGTVCYVTPSCNTIIIKSDNGEKQYSMDEYIAGAIVNYYDYKDYATSGTDVSQELLKALSVIIHSDVAAYSDYDMQNETCTLIENSRFQNIYTPTDSSESTNIDEEENDTNQNTDEENVSEDQLKTAYYNAAKAAATSVVSEVVDVYTQRMDIFYDGYESILKRVSTASYKKIIQVFMKNSPYYEEMKEEQDTEESIIEVYPVCNYSVSTSDNSKIYFADDVCSNVHINNGSNAGDHTIEEFIEGVVKNEVGAWSAYPELLKAQAVAARTYLVGRAKVENGTCYIDVGGNTLGYSPNANQAIKDAVAATAGEYLMRDGKRLTSADSRWDALRVIDGYTQNTSSPYYTIQQKNQKIPKAWLDPKLFNSISWYNKYSHGAGMSQYGAYYLAREEGKTYKEILKYYYDAEVVILSSKDYIMPINTFSKITGETTGRCGSGKTHKGIDFAAAVGTPIYVAHDGVVTRVYDNSNNCYPNCNPTDGVGIGFRIDHQDGTYSMYMHMSQRADLHKGDTVKAGQLIGYVGNTGSSDGAHLHFGLFDATTGAVLNPRNYLPLDEKGYGRCYNY